VDAFFASRGAKDAEMAALMRMTLADARQAVRIVRRRADEWGVNPHKIGFMGFSAGGGVTTQIALHYTPDSRPDYVAPIYAAVFRAVKARPDAPPLFGLCAADDEMASRANLILYKAWKAANCPVEMHIYQSGGHGFGMNKKGLPSDTWIERFEDWLRGMGIV
jgi:acetyl esterase/lipase